MKTFYLYITFLLLSFSSFAQDSLLNYLEIAARNNPTILQRYNEYQAALQKVPQVGSLPDPELSIGVFLSPMELVSGNQVADIRLMQMFPWFGVLKNAKDEMSLMAKAKFESFRDAKLQVFYDAQRTWNELQKLEQDIRIGEKNIEILRTIERLAIVKFKSTSTGESNSSSQPSSMSGGNTQNASSGSSGMNSMGGGSGNATSSGSIQQPSSSSMGSQTNGGSGLADLYRIQMEIGELNNNIALLRNQQSTIVARFNSYLNRPFKSVVSLPQTLVVDTLASSLIAVSDSILANNPMLGMLNFEKQSLDARQKMVTKMGYPMIGLGLNYSLIEKSKSSMSDPSMNGKDMIMPMVIVTLPIYRKKYNAMQSEVKLQKSATEQNYQATANALQVEYYEAIQLYQDAERRIKLYENQNQLARKTLDIMIKSFSASGSGLSDILRIRQQLLDYETRKVEAITDFNTSVAWLKRLMALSQVQ